MSPAAERALALALLALLAPVPAAGQAAVDPAPAGTDAGAPVPTVEPTSPEPEGELPDDHRPTIRLSVEPEDGLMTGDELRLVIRAVAVAGDDVSMAEQSFDALESLALLGTDVRIEPGQGEATGHSTFVLTLRFVALEPGLQILPAARLRVVTADGVIGFVDTDPMQVEVGSLVANEPNAEPKPPTDPIEVMEPRFAPGELRRIILGTLALLAFILLVAYVLYRIHKRRSEYVPPPPPPRPPAEVALEKLDILRKKRASMMREGRGVEWVDGVSDALREYLGARYGFEGLESTTDEVVARLRRASLVESARVEVSTLLHDCDLVKFAKATMDEEQCVGLLKSARRIVTTTTPAPGAPVPDASGGDSTTGGES